ncbi:MAG: sugar phosphate isomerase/epimerase [Anaerolineae bacterium]|nr:sugar phosphate isomerase/epimerase [Anaerolineae bacterium]
MTAPIAVQLWTVRNALTQDFEGTLRRIADMGYVAIEPAGWSLEPLTLYGQPIDYAAKLLRELKLSAPATHCPLPVGDNKSKVFALAEALQIEYIVCPWLPAERFESEESIKLVCDELNEAADNVLAQGLKFAYHNHHFEFVPTSEGLIPHEVMRQHLSPSILFEIDTYWAQVGGADPVALVKDLGKRAPLLHIKDGPAKLGVPQTAVGEGVVDVRGLVAASKDTAEWLVVELDECATDIFEAIDKSHQFLSKL